MSALPKMDIFESGLITKLLHEKEKKYIYRNSLYRLTVKAKHPLLYIPAKPEARRALPCLKYYISVILLLCPATSQQCEAYSSLVQKDDFMWPIKSIPYGKHTHTYEQAMKTMFAIMQPKQHADN